MKAREHFDKKQYAEALTEWEKEFKKDFIFDTGYTGTVYLIIKAAGHVYKKSDGFVYLDIPSYYFQFLKASYYYSQQKYQNAIPHYIKMYNLLEEQAQLESRCAHWEPKINYLYLTAAAWDHIGRCYTQLYSQQPNEIHITKIKEAYLKAMNIAQPTDINFRHSQCCHAIDNYLKVAKELKNTNQFQHAYLLIDEAKDLTSNLSLDKKRERINIINEELIRLLKKENKILERSEKNLENKIVILEQKDRIKTTKIEEIHKKIITEQEVYNSILLKGATEGNWDQIKIALKIGANIKCKNEHGQTILHLALENNHLSIAEILLQKNPELFTKTDNKGLAPVDLMAKCNQLDIALNFITASTNININKELIALIATPILIFSAQYGLIKSIISALEKGADLSGRDSLGRTALHRAVIAGNIDVIELLLKQHAAAKIDIDLKDKAGKTPYDLAKDLNKKIIIKNKEKLLEIYLLEKFWIYKFDIKSKKKFLIANTRNSFIMTIPDQSAVQSKNKPNEIKNML